MESVLVGVDHSRVSRHAVKFALKHARVSHWRVTVIHVVNWSKFSFPTVEENANRSAARRRQIAAAEAEVLQPIREWAERKGLLDGVEFETRVHFGRPSETLAELAAEGDHDAIVVARTGESNLKAAIFGSTANRLVQHASVPVVVVP